MSDPFLGEIRPFGFNFPPRGWALCSGQILPIAQNQALFSLLGTTYGGNGQTTFALPNLNERVANSQGQGPGLSNYDLGQVGGASEATLLQSQIPSHGHSVSTAASPTTNSPVGALPASSVGHALYDSTVNSAMAPDTIAPAGGSQPHENMQPTLVINYSIALQGIFPPRN
ncbi:MAG: tail fiber protein [Fimbriimonadaceae bacterium]